MKKIFHFFDKLEDNIRATLSKHNILYAFIGGVAIVLFWRGVWMTADAIPFLTGPISILISVIVLLGTGLFVSFFIGDEIIISGIKKEKRLDEKVASEVKTELDVLNNIQKRLDNIEKELKIR
ncbi:MAG: hypothetical protein A2481_02655 [Candidatus Yonathbacteria bacterium RIFOXYC2_FULL_47_9]|nr:MAG: hypothetical protein A2481_02655 [Candidatus Yonathbacteria bacterium RIFOXYC2_FULL_47_9]HAT68335.1 hypothetical protein [Candidatus Yonathbacteria bacterium]